MTVSFAYIVTLWGADSGKPFNIIAVVAGLGKILAPIIAIPFIMAASKGSMYGSSHDHNYTNISLNNQSLEIYQHVYNGHMKAYKGHVYKVYLIISGLITGGTLFCAYLIKITKPSDTSLNYSINKVREVHKPANSSRSRFSVILYCTAFFLYFFLIDIVIEGSLNFLYKIAVEASILIVIRH